MCLRASPSPPLPALPPTHTPDGPVASESGGKVRGGCSPSCLALRFGHSQESRGKTSSFAWLIQLVHRMKSRRLLPRRDVSGSFRHIPSKLNRERISKLRRLSRTVLMGERERVRLRTRTSQGPFGPNTTVKDRENPGVQRVYRMRTGVGKGVQQSRARLRKP